MQKIKRKILACFVTSMMIFTMAVPENVYAAKVSYTDIYSILSSYQYFVKGNVNISNHSVGAIIAGGTARVGAFGDGAIADSYFETLESCGNFNSGNYLSGTDYSGYTGKKAYYKNKAESASIGTNIEQYQGSYIDMDSTFEMIKSTSKEWADEADTSIDEADLVEGQFSDKSQEKAKVLIISGKANNVRITEKAITNCDYIVFTDIQSMDELITEEHKITILGKEVNLAADYNSIGTAKTVMYTNDKGDKQITTSSAMKVVIADDGHGLKTCSAAIKGGQLKLDGMKLIWNLPQCKKLTATYLPGHIVAPEAELYIKGGNFEGDIIADSVKECSAEGHFYPYYEIGKMSDASAEDSSGSSTAPSGGTDSTETGTVASGSPSNTAPSGSAGGTETSTVPSTGPSGTGSSAAPSTKPSSSPSGTGSSAAPSSSPSDTGSSEAPSTKPSGGTGGTETSTVPSTGPSGTGSSAAPSTKPSSSPSGTGSSAAPSSSPSGTGSSAAPSSSPSDTGSSAAPSTKPSGGTGGTGTGIVPSSSPSGTGSSTVPSTSPSGTGASTAPSTKPSTSPSGTELGTMPSSSPSDAGSSAAPSTKPSTKPSTGPSGTGASTAPSTKPSTSPSDTGSSTAPSSKPSTSPSDTGSSTAPSAKPSSKPSTGPSGTGASTAPSTKPSTSPSGTGSSAAPSTKPSTSPSGTGSSVAPSSKPSSSPSDTGSSTAPSSKPSTSPSGTGSSTVPSSSPSAAPSTKPSGGTGGTGASTSPSGTAPSTKPSGGTGGIGASTVPSSSPSDTVSSTVPSTKPSGSTGGTGSSTKSNSSHSEAVPSSTPESPIIPIDNTDSLVIEQEGSVPIREVDGTDVDREQEKKLDGDNAEWQKTGDHLTKTRTQIDSSHKETGNELPKTGGMGTVWLIAAGVAMIFAGKKADRRKEKNN